MIAYADSNGVLNRHYRVSDDEVRQVLVEDFMSDDGRDRVEVDSDYEGPERAYEFDSVRGLHCYYTYFSDVPSWRPQAVSIDS